MSGLTAKVPSANILNMKGFQCDLARGSCLLEESNPDDIDNSHEKPKTERNDQDNFLFLWEAHLSQNRHWKKKNSQVGDNIHGRRGQIECDDIDTVRVGWNVGEPRGRYWSTLENIDQCQCKASRIDYRKSDIVCIAKHLLIPCQSHVENEDRRFDGHQCWTLFGNEDQYVVVH